MKPNPAKFNAVKKTTARKKVIDAQQQLDNQVTIDQEEYNRRVAIKAYELFERRGCQHGSHLDDWYQAERIVQEGLA
jgi:hypothetical protein